MTLSAQPLAVFALTLLGCCCLPAVSPAQAPSASPNVIRQVDHILISSSHAEELFSLLTETFELPVAWPMSDYGGFSSGGVAVGNVNLEIIRSAPRPDNAARGQFVGFALEPEPLKISLPELDARSIPHGSAVPFKSHRWFGLGSTLWTTVALPTLSSNAVEVFLCAYPDGLTARRQRLREQLRSRNGGPLSVESVREIVCGTTDLNRSLMQWRKLLHPLQPSSAGTWRFAAGPAIRLVQADDDAIQQLVITVTSLEQARRFLWEQNLLGADRPLMLTMDGPAIDGLRITFAEQQ